MGGEAEETPVFTCKTTVWGNSENVAWGIITLAILSVLSVVFIAINQTRPTSVPTTWICTHRQTHMLLECAVAC